MHKKSCRPASAIFISLLLVSQLSAQIWLRNGSFTAASGENGDPADWGLPSEPVEISRDTVDYYSEPASVWLGCEIDTGSGNLSQGFGTSRRLPAEPGETFTWSAYVKCTRLVGNASASLVAHYSVGAFWVESENSWNSLEMIETVTSGWMEVGGTSTVPVDATWGLFRVFISGVIEVNFDDIVINGQEEYVTPVVWREQPEQIRPGTTDGHISFFRLDGRQLLRSTYGAEKTAVSGILIRRMDNSKGSSRAIVR